MIVGFFSGYQLYLVSSFKISCSANWEQVQKVVHFDAFISVLAKLTPFQLMFLLVLMLRELHRIIVPVSGFLCLIPKLWI